MQDWEIIDLYFARDERAIEETSGKYGAYCYTVARNIVPAHEDAEECVSDTWLSAWNTIPPQRPNILRAFLAKITRSKALDRWKMMHTKKRGEGELPLVFEELEECISSGSGPEKDVLRSELTACIDAFLGTLSVRDRQLFVRRYFFTEPLETIAENAGIPVNTAAAAIRRTRLKLKDHLIGEGYGA